MDCNLDRNLLQESLDGSLNWVEDLLLMDHLRVCKSCREEYDRMATFFSDLDSLADLVHIPDNLLLIRNQQLKDLIELEAGPAYSYKSMVSVQKAIIKSAGNFTKFVPGSDHLEQGLKRAPQALFRTFNFVFKKGISFAANRVRT